MTTGPKPRRNHPADPNDFFIEEWREIVGWPYEVSNLGRVRRIGKSVPLRLSPNSHGYLQANIYRDGERLMIRAHVEVCVAFHGPRPSPAHHAAHGDGVRTNNAASNLRWATAAENSADKIAHGTHRAGDRHPRAILNSELVGEIRAAHAAAMGVQRVRRGTIPALASRYGVGIHVIKDVIAGRCWL